VLVAYDKLAEWDVLAARKPVLEQVRAQLLASSDTVVGLSKGSIDDVPDAFYVGHGVDRHWHDPAIDSLSEPADLAAIPRPRAVYVGALSMRFDVDAVRDLADAGIDVVLVGMAPQPALVELAARDPRIHLLGERRPEQAAAYLLHSDVGIVPHTDEPFTYSMEPHKAYNYAAAGLPTVTLNTAHAPALGPFLNATRDREAFVEGVRAAIASGRLSVNQVVQARSLSWGRVADAILDAA
jgi:Glycosyl transferases group 1